MISILKSKTTWLAVLLFVINGLQFAQTLLLTTAQMEVINVVLGMLVFINRHYLPSSKPV